MIIQWVALCKKCQAIVKILTVFQSPDWCLWIKSFVQLTAQQSPNSKIKVYLFVPGRAPHPFSQPHQRSVCEEPSRSAPMSTVRPSARKNQLGFTQNYLPLSHPSRIPTQVPPSPKLQWYLPLLFHFFTYRHQNLFQDQKRWVDMLTLHWLPIHGANGENWEGLF